MIHTFSSQNMTRSQQLFYDLPVYGSFDNIVKIVFRIIIIKFEKCQVILNLCTLWEYSVSDLGKLHVLACSSFYDISLYVSQCYNHTQTTYQGTDLS